MCIDFFLCVFVEATGYISLLITSYTWYKGSNVLISYTLIYTLIMNIFHLHTSIWVIFHVRAVRLWILDIHLILCFLLVGCNGHADLENIKVERNISRSVDTDLPPPMDESDIEYVNNINEWLSLRVQGGSRAWKLSCLNAPQTND